MLLVVVSRSLKLARSRLGTFFTAGWAYMLVLLAVNLAISVAMTPDTGFQTGSYMMEPFAGGDGADDPDRAKALRGLAVLANLLAGFSIAIAYVRRIVTGRREFFLAFGLRHVRVAWELLLLGLLGTGILMALFFGAAFTTLIAPPVGAALMILCLPLSVMLVQRFSLVLPAAALDDPLTLRESWRLTAGLSWALTIAALAVLAVAGAAVGIWTLLLGLFDTALALGGSGPLAQVRSALLPMGTMVIVTWLLSSLHVTAYGLVRERVARQVGLQQAEVERAERLRGERQRAQAHRAVAAVRDIGRRRR
ncbi:4-hydroxy-3-methylbut-2-en-1-yl diphosphate synthase [Stappia taiwanensis]|uniref:4-hydroxy-3-methylbut-2-en-1-yl diphosphate synthase n=1 Tax=Stappia taiwanensis TaxID=992267 RepID=A0A838XLQ8_9HYPH|nr:4-hydroxy-3-methylbut-2-en-1-yl diphosphate synthase [Stappia taiwanensis]MBA4611425.1 4-hydroxy-3-methylbut-2-en-1-yl diphosphate synthase [Stappia taiwanensis]GGF00428.1 hypothetical protein GCM10007285_30000 [Stappia taiwanensis]